eukprot:14655907-Alexandrium_andersonii.AAC.1
MEERPQEADVLRALNHEGVLTRHSSRSGAILPSAGAPRQSSAQALAALRGRHGPKSWPGAERSSSGNGDPEASPM